jgi:hypothetical protein
MPHGSLDDAVAYGLAISGRLKAGITPRDAAWRAGRVALFERWLAQGGSE